MTTIETDRLLLRAPVEADRERFVELFTDEAFMVYGGVLDSVAASARFNQMLAVAEAIPYGKQPVIDRVDGAIVGYTGVDTVEFDGLVRLEWGWRFVPEARGRGYVTEATVALLEVAGGCDSGEVLCMIAADNHASRRVAGKTGFRYWKRVNWNGDPGAPTDLFVRPVGAGGPPLLAPDLA